VGVIEDADGIGRLGDAACGDVFDVHQGAGRPYR
jgi:hypothetical protein